MPRHRNQIGRAPVNLAATPNSRAIKVRYRLIISTAATTPGPQDAEECLASQGAIGDTSVDMFYARAGTPSGQKLPADETIIGRCGIAFFATTKHFSHGTRYIFLLARASSMRKMWGMKLAKSNRFLHPSKQAATGLWVSAKTSSAVEGIRQPFSRGAKHEEFASERAFTDYWKQRVSKSAR